MSDTKRGAGCSDIMTDMGFGPTGKSLFLHCSRGTVYSSIPISGCKTQNLSANHVALEQAAIAQTEVVEVPGRSPDYGIFRYLAR